MDRFFQWLLIISTLAFSWLAMMAIHEFGHVLHAWLSGGTVARVILHPFTISQTLFTENPRPLFVAWGGPIWGSILPLLLFGVMRVTRWRYWYLSAFFAGFCLIANGAYIGGGSFTEVGDPGDLLRHGAPRWQLLLFGFATIAIGLSLWHRLGPHFGLGPTKTRVDRKAAVGMAAAFGVIFLAELSSDFLLTPG